MKYKFVEDLTSDVMFEAYGKDLKELFINAAEALLSVICDIKKVKPKEPEEFLIKGEDAENLLINWLDGIIAIVDTEQKFFSKIEIGEIDENHIKSKLYGESTKPELGGTVVKAVTMYKFKLEETKKGLKATVSLDI